MFGQFRTVFFYLNSRKVDYVTNETEEDKMLITLNASENNPDREISKKITLMQYFRKYLNGGTVTEEEHTGLVPTQRKSPFVYIKKWVKS